MFHQYELKFIFMILLLDASNKTPFLALINNSEVIDFEQLDGSIPLSRTLYPALNSLLKKNQLLPQQVKKAIFGKGPGSFLGIRTAANLCSALSCSLSIEVGSFISPLAYLPFKQGKFAYLMKPKGGKYPVLLGIKNELESKIISTQFLSSLNEFFTTPEIMSAKSEYVVVDPAFKNEFDSCQEELGIKGSHVICEQQIDKAFLPVLAQCALTQENETPEKEEETSSGLNPFGLIY